jgi:phage-related protein
MEVLTSDIIVQKNKLAGDQPWLLLLEVDLTDSETIYLVRNTEDITFGSQLYQAFPFEIDERQQVSQGEIPSLTLKVGNPERTVQQYLEDYDGLVGNEITLRIVSRITTILSEDFEFTDSGGFNWSDSGGFVFATDESGEQSVWTQALAFTYEVLGCTADSTWVTFTLGAPNPLNRRFPLYKYISNHCNWKFGNDECNYSFTPVGTWTVTTQYWPGDLVYPNTAAGLNHTFRCVNAGKSGTTEPSWSTVTVAIFNEESGPVQWIESTLTTWTALRTYYEGDVVHPITVTSTTKNYRSTTNGISGSTEPTWPTRLGGTVSEGSITVTWVMNDCKRSLKNCRDLSMSDNFGGHPGLSSGGMKVV